MNCVHDIEGCGVCRLLVLLLLLLLLLSTDVHRDELLYDGDDQRCMVEASVADRDRGW